MKYLLDTCVISELMKPVPNERVVRWLSSLQQTDVFVSVFTVGLTVINPFEKEVV